MLLQPDGDGKYVWESGAVYEGNKVLRVPAPRAKLPASVK
jgi:hypothetical protein